MLRIILILSLSVLFLSCSDNEGNRSGLLYDSVEISFKGKGEFKIARSLQIVVTDSCVVNHLNKSKNNVSIQWFMPSLKGQEYITYVVFSDTSSGKQLFCRITKDLLLPATVEFGSGTWFDLKYRNDDFVDYVNGLIRLDSIQEYNIGNTPKI
jgi:hypothetical protein